MTSIPISEAIKSEPRFESALNLCIAALRRLAEFELDPAIARRVRELGEGKEFLAAQEHDELMSLVAFCEQRTREKLEANLALQRLREVAPQLVEFEIPIVG